MALKPKLEALPQKYDNVYVREIDVVDWESEAAKQADQELGLEAIPYILIYGTDGKLVKDFIGPSIEEIEATIQEQLKK